MYNHSQGPPSRLERQVLKHSYTSNDDFVNQFFTNIITLLLPQKLTIAEVNHKASKLYFIVYKLNMNSFDSSEFKV